MVNATVSKKPESLIEIAPDTPETRKIVEQALSRLVELRERPVFCMYQNDELDEDLNHKYVKRVRAIAPRLKSHDAVSVFIESPGGDIECAYRILSAIRRHVTSMEVLITDWAKSAATFFCLGADRIFLGPDGELGPLDPQLKSPTGSLRRSSALETFKALEYLRTYSLETLGQILTLLVDVGEMDIPYAMGHARDLLSAVTRPLYEQVNPHELGQVRRYLSISEEYAKRVMQRWSYKDRDEKEISRIVYQLVWYYPTHGFVIDLAEAKALNLNVDSLDADTDAVCKQILETVNGCTGIWLPLGKNDSETVAAELTGLQEKELGDGKGTTAGAPGDQEIGTPNR